jgi:AcrR family transcriptional regulator
VAERKRKADAPDLLVEAFTLIAERGWPGLNMADLAARAGVSLVEVYRRMPSRAGLIAALGRRADEAMLAGDDPEFAVLPPRDRAFELIMRRFDGLAPFKPGPRRLARDGRGDPLVWLVTGCNLDRAATWRRSSRGCGGSTANSGSSPVSIASSARRPILAISAAREGSWR